MREIQEIGVEALNELLQSASTPVRLVDIRTTNEVAQGVIPGAEFVPMQLIPRKMESWRGDELVVLYCRSGVRSAQACVFLAEQGLTNIVNLRGGIVDWHRLGLPVVAPETLEVAV